jgi:hypothetical protein
MGGKQLAGVLDIIQREAAAKKGETVDEQKLSVMKQMVEGRSTWRAIRTSRAPGCGTTGSSIRATPAACSRSRSRPAYTLPVEGTTRWGVFRH